MNGATLDLETLLSLGMDTELDALEPANCPLFSAPNVTLGELETMISEAMDREFSG